MKNSSLHSTRVTRAAVETAWSPDQAERGSLSSTSRRGFAQPCIVRPMLKETCSNSRRLARTLLCLGNRCPTKRPCLVEKAVENSVPCLLCLQMLLDPPGAVHKQEGLRLRVKHTTPVRKERMPKEVPEEKKPSTSVSSRLVVPKEP